MISGGNDFFRESLTAIFNQKMCRAIGGGLGLLLARSCLRHCDNAEAHASIDKRETQNAHYNDPAETQTDGQTPAGCTPEITSHHRPSATA